MALCCQNQVSKGTNQRYELHGSVGISVHSASVTVLGLLKKKKGIMDMDSGHQQTWTVETDKNRRVATNITMIGAKLRH